jgi:hypothetical protein
VFEKGGFIYNQLVWKSHIFVFGVHILIFSFQSKFWVIKILELPF